MQRLLFFTILIFTAFRAGAQTTEDSVKTAVSSLFNAMRKADSAAAAACFAPGAMLQSISGRPGNDAVHNTTAAEFANIVARFPSQAVDERIAFAHIVVDDRLASVWAPYRLYFKGTFSHCGVDAFQLVRIEGVWKIQYIIDTRRKDNCVEEAAVK